MSHTRGHLASSVALLLGLLVLGTGGAANPVVVQGIQGVAVALERNPAGVNAQANAVAPALKDMDGIMELFKTRSRGGFGVGPQPGVIKPDGIESKIMALDKRPPTAPDLAANGVALAELGYRSAAVGLVIANKVPEDKKKDAQAWQQASADLTKNAVAFAEAVKKGVPDDVQKTAKALNNTCVKCHEAFR